MNTLLSRVHPRLLRCVVANVAVAAILAVFIWLTAPTHADAWAILRWWIPAWLIIGTALDYFVRRTPAKEAAREAQRAARHAKREAHRPNIRL